MLRSLLLEDGIDLFDKVCTNFTHFFSLAQRGVSRVTRAKDNTVYAIRKKLLRGALILLKILKSKPQYSGLLRRVEIIVIVDGKEVVMVFITNSTEWAASTVGEFYQVSWGIEVFFKQIKRHCRSVTSPDTASTPSAGSYGSFLLLYVLMRF